MEKKSFFSSFSFSPTALEAIGIWWCFVVFFFSSIEGHTTYYIERTIQKKEKKMKRKACKEDEREEIAIVCVYLDTKERHCIMSSLIGKTSRYKSSAIIIILK